MKREVVRITVRLTLDEAALVLTAIEGSRATYADNDGFDAEIETLNAVTKRMRAAQRRQYEQRNG